MTIELTMKRLELYLERVKHDLQAGDRAGALADLAEVGEISRRLWDRLARARAGKKEAPVRDRL
jgi:hypothetical protein